MPAPQQAQTPPKIDFGQYSAAPSIDFTNYASPADTSADDTRWNALKDKYDLPHNVDLSKTLMENALGKNLTSEEANKIDIEKFSKAYQEANPNAAPTGFFSRSFDELKNLFKGAAENPASVAGFTSPNPIGAVEAAKSRGREVIEHPAAAAGAGLVDLTALAAPFLPELTGAALEKVNPMGRVQSALARRLSLEEATAPRSTSTSQPALNVTPNDVFNHASQEGIKLTPGQALEDPAATNVQKMGTTAMIGGKDLAQELRAQRGAFVDSVNKLGKTVDPGGVGLNDETAGHTIQRGVQQNLNSLKGKASATYNQVAQQQQNLSGDIRGLSDFAKAKRTETITSPTTGETSTRPIYQAPEVKAALDDIASKPEELGANPSIASLRSLRSEFWEKGNDYSGNIPDSARALYKQAAAHVDDAITNAAKGTPFEGTFREANAQWKDLQSKYNEPGQPLYKILQTDNPTKIVSQLQNASADDITMLRKELGDGPAVQALRRSVINDISNNKFTVKSGGLGGYSHEYLNSLFGPETTKELYVKADLSRRIGYDANPSGTGSAISVMEQGGSIRHQPKLTAFAKLSMPRDPLSFLPESGASSPTSRGSLPRPVSISGPQSFGPKRPSTLTGSPGMFSDMVDMTIKQLDTSIAKETNPAEKMRLQKMRADYATGNF